MNKKMLPSTLSAMVLRELITGKELDAKNTFSDDNETIWS